MSWLGDMISIVFTHIKDVNSYLTLAAFIVAILLVGYIRWLGSREKREKAAIEANNQLETERLRRVYGMPTGSIPGADIKPVLLANIRNAAKRNTLIAVVVIALAVVVAAVAIASFFVHSPSTQQAASAEGGLGILVNAFNASPDDFSVTLADQNLTNFWVTDSSGPTTRAIVQKVCDVNQCLSCDPKEIGSARHVTIRLSGKLDPFRDAFNATWQRCAP